MTSLMTYSQLCSDLESAVIASRAHAPPEHMLYWKMRSPEFCEEMPVPPGSDHLRPPATHTLYLWHEPVDAALRDPLAATYQCAYSSETTLPCGVSHATESIPFFLNQVLHRREVRLWGTGLLLPSLGLQMFTLRPLIRQETCVAQRYTRHSCIPVHEAYQLPS